MSRDWALPFFVVMVLFFVVVQCSIFIGLTNVVEEGKVIADTISARSSQVWDSNLRHRAEASFGTIVQRLGEIEVKIIEEALLIEEGIVKEASDLLSSRPLMNEHVYVPNHPVPKPPRGRPIEYSEFFDQSAANPAPPSRPSSGRAGKTMRDSSSPPDPSAVPLPTQPAVERSAASSSVSFPKWTPFDFSQDSRPGLDLRDAIATCRKCLWRTIETTTKLLDDGGTFVFTGDIDDLWLRDSAAQVHMYIPLMRESPELARVVRGLIKRHAFYIRFDPWSNAYRVDTSYKFNAEQRSLGRHGYISTRNYEVDSGCYFLRMVHRTWTVSPEEPILHSSEVIDAASILIDLWHAEQRHEEDDYPSGSLFDCKNCGGPYRYKKLARGGKGKVTKYTGMTWSGFRPSDDQCEHNFNVPGNMFAVASLRQLADLALNLWGRSDIASRATNLANEIDRGIREHGVVNHPRHGKIYAYEVDGLGHYTLMDDANVPSLLSIPYLGYAFDDEIYRATRAFVLSRDNPTFAQSSDGKVAGIGSPHMKKTIPKNVWPMGILTQGLTSSDLEEKLRMVNMALKTTGGTGWMHESFDVNNPRKFTRKWFCWADALFAELVLSMSKDCLAKPWPKVPDTPRKPV